MSVSAGMFAASDPHVPKRDATPQTIGPSRESVCHIADIIGIGRGSRMNTAFAGNNSLVKAGGGPTGWLPDGRANTAQTVAIYANVPNDIGDGDHD